MGSHRDGLTSSTLILVYCSLDLVFVLCATIGSAAVIWSIDAVLLDMFAGLALILFLPGYAVVSALFPRTDVTTVRSEMPTNDTPGDAKSGRYHLDSAERIVLAIVGSLSLAILLGFILSYTWGVTLGSVLFSLCASTVLAVLLAMYRRLRVPRPNRFTVYRPNSNRLSASWTASRREFAVNAIAGIAVLFGSGTALYTVASPPRGESYTEFYLLTETDDGELVADDYPREFEVNESRSLVIGIDNREQESMEYTVVATIQRVEENEDSLEIVDQAELAEFTSVVESDESRLGRIELTPTMTGNRLRLSFQLYKGGRPSELRSEAAYRDLHLWISVGESEDE